MFDAVQHRMMFGGTADGDTTMPTHGTKDGRVVGFGATAGEDNLTGGTPEHVGNVIACFIDHPACRT